MSFIQFSRVSLAFGGRDILKDVSVNLKKGTAAALTGANGAGKSTLIKVMAGIVEPDSGTRAAEKGCRVGYLPQSGLSHSGRRLIDEADGAFEWGYEIQRRIDEIGDEMREKKTGAQSLAARQADLIARLDESGWHRRRQSEETVLLGLGFSREDFGRMTDEFSGGWQMRIALAKVLLLNPDILLLDEPTNYLDIEARTWLEKFLQSFAGGFLLVSHDRYFLDVTVSEVYELDRGRLRRYAGNFSRYEESKEAELKALAAESERQEKEIERLQDFINRFGYKATKAAQAQERQKMLDRLLANRIELPESAKKIHFKFPGATRSGKIVLRAEGLSKSYGGRAVIKGLDMILERGERLVVAGRNGAGKSTLLRVLAGADKNFEGSVALGAEVSVGYFSQDSAESARGGVSALEYIEEAAPLDLVPKARDMLGAFLFRGDDVLKSLDVLSGGEKSRLSLLRLLLRPVNLLILDEPTNHLDMASKDTLLAALEDFGGTVVFVSHDRAFIESLATRVLELSPSGARFFPGGYAYYLQRLADEEAGVVPPPAGASTAESDCGEKEGGGKASWRERKKGDADRRKAEREAARLEGEIERKESEKKSLEAMLSLPEVYSNGEKSRDAQAKIASAAREIDELTRRWESVVTGLE